MKKLIFVLVVLALAVPANAIVLQNVYAHYSFDQPAPLSESTGTYSDLTLSTVAGPSPTVGVAAGYSGECFESTVGNTTGAYASSVPDAPFKLGFDVTGTQGHIAMDMMVNLPELPAIGNGMHFFGGTGAEYSFNLKQDAVGVWLRIWTYDTQDVVNSDYLTWNVDQWYNLTFVMDETNDRMYILKDGVEVGSKDYPEAVNMAAFSRPVSGKIGAHGATGKYGIKGKIDELRIGQIPEPATICLLGLGALTVLRRKR